MSAARFVSPSGTLKIMTVPSDYRVTPGAEFRLSDWPTHVDEGVDRDAMKAELRALHEQLEDRQERLFAEAKQSLLIVFQAMDTGGKDSTIRSVLGPLNPQGVRVWNFKAPTPVELAHDFLWRVHRKVPGAGYIGVFNRSHYEDVLIVRVKNLVSDSVWRARYEHINAFEKLLTSEGVTVIKFFLHISKAFQRARFEKRLANPSKHWKFNPADLKERARWDDYMNAYEEAICSTSTAHAPWYVVPAEHRPYRDLVVGRAILSALDRMNPQFPKPDFDPSTVRID